MESVKLEWMYQSGEGSVDREEYLLGKAVDKAFERSELDSSGRKDSEKDNFPPSLFVDAGSSVHVDVFRKKQEDPLEAIRQKEIEYRKQLLKNPIKLKKIQDMLKQQEKNSKSKIKKKKKKKKDSKESDDLESEGDLNKILTAKYMKLLKKYGAKKLQHLQSNSESSDSDQDCEKRKNEKKGERIKRSLEDKNLEELHYSKKIKKNKSLNDEKRRSKERYHFESEKRSSCSPDSEMEYKNSDNKRGSDKKYKEKSSRHRYRNSSSSERDALKNKESKKCDSDFKASDKKKLRRSDSPKPKTSRTQDRQKEAYGLSVPEGKQPVQYSREARETKIQKPENKYWVKKGPVRLTEEEKEKRRKEMMDNAKWRDEMRVKNVSKYKNEEAKEKLKEKEYNPEFMRKQMAKVISVHDSVEGRIKSKINTIQRTKADLDKNFVRR